MNIFRYIYLLAGGLFEKKVDDRCHNRWISIEKENESFWFLSNWKEYDHELTVYLLIMNQMESRLVQIQKENCHYDHFPFNLKGIRKRIIWVYRH